MKIIGIVGQAGSGKTEAGEYIERKYKIRLYNSSDVLVDIAKERNLPTNKNSLGLLANKLRDEHGNAFVSEQVLKKIKNDGVNVAVVTGFRTPEDIDYIRNEVDDFLLIWVDADPGVRYERRRERELSEEDFFARNEDDMKVKHLGKVLLMAEEKIENNGTQEELDHKIDNILKKYGIIQ